ncbi:hypothetical protein RSPO_c00037 [Ralstonia solanacearum Po82]|uniref:Uncharacterized protein n=1 Tax=Ralstonia solanacearum (strain Po82) TaxID=1031711 RepID=F6G4T2_RALS8|nr:hypothetical protein RSPO_c00037 [Ralstonia solanacearum Po82]
MPLRFGRSRSIAPSRIDEMDRRPVVVGRIEFHGSCTLCIHCNVVASRSFVRKGTFTGRRRPGDSRGRLASPGGASSASMPLSALPSATTRRPRWECRRMAHSETEDRRRWRRYS